MLIVAIVVNTTFAVLHASLRSLVVASTLFVIVMYAYRTYGTMYEESRATWEAGSVKVEARHGSVATAEHTDPRALL